MKMHDKKFLCCEKCVEEIGKKSCNAAKLWMDLCEIEFTYGLLNFKAVEDPDLRVLESLGYILTTDIENYVVIKLFLDEELYRGTSLFCVRGEGHE